MVWKNTEDLISSGLKPPFEKKQKTKNKTQAAKPYTRLIERAACFALVSSQTSDLQELECF